MSRRFNRAAIISRLFFAAFLISLSRLRFLFETLDMGISFEDAWQRVFAKGWVEGVEILPFYRAVKPDWIKCKADVVFLRMHRSTSALTSEQSSECLSDFVVEEEAN
jgi:hypothetical protein